MIGLIGAMKVEMERLLLDVKEPVVHHIGQMTFTAGNLYGQDAVLSICGPGKVNAALHAQMMIVRFSTEWVMNLGVAGAISDELNIGDMVLGTAAVQHDADTTPLGDPLGMLFGIQKIQLPCSAPINEKLLDAAKRVPGLRLYQGIIASGDQFVADHDRKAWIAEHFGAMACEMEGGAVAQACYMHGVGCVLLRSISDQANGEAHMDFAQFTTLAAEHSSQLVKVLLVSLKKK